MHLHSFSCSERRTGLFLLSEDSGHIGRAFHFAITPACCCDHAPGVCSFQPDVVCGRAGKRWEDEEALQRVAQRLQERGLLVVEPPEAPLLTQANPFQGPLPTLSELFGDADKAGSALPVRLCCFSQRQRLRLYLVLLRCCICWSWTPQPASEDAGADASHDVRAQVGGEWRSTAQEAAKRESLQAHLAARMTGVGPCKARQMVDEYSDRIIKILDGTPAAAQAALMKLKGVGKITAARMKASWDKSKSKRARPPSC